MTATTQPGITLDEQIAQVEAMIAKVSLHPNGKRLAARNQAILASLIRLREIEGKLRDRSSVIVPRKYGRVDFGFIPSPETPQKRGPMPTVTVVFGVDEFDERDQFGDALLLHSNERWAVVETDNYGGDYPDEKFIVAGMQNEGYAKEIANMHNKETGRDSSRFYKVVKMPYQLQPGFEP